MGKPPRMRLVASVRPPNRALIIVALYLCCDNLQQNENVILFQSLQKLKKEYLKKADKSLSGKIYISIIQYNIKIF